jgi:hypothetical protein
MEEKRGFLIMVAFVGLAVVAQTVELFGLWPEDLMYVSTILLVFGLLGFVITFFILQKKNPQIIKNLLRKEKKR